MSEWLQFVMAFPILVIGIGCFIRALLAPGSIGMIRLSLFSFTMQYCIGPIKAPFISNGPTFESADVFLTFVTIYLFWLAIFLTAMLWRSRLDPILFSRHRGLSSERGIFAGLTDATLRARAPTVLAFYLLVVTVRVGMLTIYDFGLSGTRTLEKAMRMPYIVLAIYGLFADLGMAFIFLSITKFLYRQPGRMWYALIIVLEVLYCFTQGRRALYIASLFVLFPLLMKHGRIKIGHALLGAFGAIVMWQIVFPLFVNLRAQWQDNPQGTVSIWIETAWKNTLTGGQYGELTQGYNASIQSRLNALSLNYEVANHLRNGYKPVYGEFLKQAAMGVVPRFLFPNKLLIVGGDDALLNECMDLHEGDLFSNFPVFAMADFGVAGGLIYGVIFALALRAIEVMIKVLFRRNSLGAFAIFSVAASNMVLQMEFPPGSFMVCFRLMCFIFVVFYILSSIFGSADTDETGYGYGQAEPSAELDNTHLYTN